MTYEPRELRCNGCGASLHLEPDAAVLTCAHCGTEYAVDAPEEAGPPFYEAEVLSWLRQGRKIEAIKAVRAHTGMGLREAKYHVEGLAAREGIALPRGSAQALVVIGAVIAVAVAGAVAYMMFAGH